MEGSIERKMWMRGGGGGEGEEEEDWPRKRAGRDLAKGRLARAEMKSALEGRDFGNEEGKNMAEITQKVRQFATPPNQIGPCLCGPKMVAPSRIGLCRPKGN